MTATAATYLTEHCRVCEGNGYIGRGLVPCAACNATGRRLRGAHDAESAVDFEPPPAGRLVPTALLRRMATLVATLRSPQNNAVEGELYDLVDEAQRGANGGGR